MIGHPAELRMQDINTWDRKSLVQGLLAFNDFCFCQFTAEALEQMPDRQLRRLLVAVRQHYHAKGY